MPVLSALTDSYSDVRCHTVVFILPALDRLQAGPVGGCIRAGKADECVGCKRRAHSSQGMKEGALGMVVPTSDTWHVATATLAISAVSIYLRFFPSEKWPSEGFKHKQGVMGLKLKQGSSGWR